MEKIIFAVLAVGLVVCLFYNLKKECKNDKLVEICMKADIDKTIELLEKGLDPNTMVLVWKAEFGSNPPEYWDCSHYEIQTLLDISSNPAVKKLLRAYGGKTIEEIRAEEAAIEGARKAETKPQVAILEAERKAKEEADMRKVEAFLASKGKKA